jgi:hypothetical protein
VCNQIDYPFRTNTVYGMRNLISLICCVINKREENFHPKFYPELVLKKLISLLKQKVPILIHSILL